MAYHLFMTFPSPAAEPEWSGGSDLTAKARIRNAAFELHATKGVARTTMRDVAQAAGVTHGLVIHHFGNKEGLRVAVQKHMIDLLRQALESVPVEGTATEVGRARDEAVERMYADNPAYVRYLRRALADPSYVDTGLLDLLIEFTASQVRLLRDAGVARADSSEEVQILAVLLRHLGPRLLQPVIEELWARLSPHGAPTPRIEIRVSPRDPSDTR